MSNLDETRPEPPRSADETALDANKWFPPESTLALTSFGNYEIIGEIARGGVGVIYRAKQKGLERIVALKVLQSGTTASTEQVKRFFQEAQSAAKLQHPNIVPIHDFGSQDGQHYFTMDFIEGSSLADVLISGPMQMREAMEIIRQVSDALHYAHDRGVIHRDIKPGNILVDKDGRIKVTDFGLAKEITSKEMSLTVTGQVMGTPRYMSPEQAAGKTAQADQRSDVFSLGVTLYEMITGKPAFEADNVVAMLQKVLNEDPPAPQKVNGKVHRDVATICMKAIEKDPRRRYQTSKEMTDDIERFLAGEPIEAKAVGMVGRTARKLKRYAKVVAINAMLASVAIYLLVYYLNSRPSQLSLELRTDGAEAAVDGNILSDAQLKQPLSLRAGKHRLLVVHDPDYDPEEIEFKTEPAESRTITVTLQRRKGTVVVTTDPADAAVTILGANGFRIPLRGPRVQQELPTGHYALLIHRENYLAKDVDFAVESRATNSFNITLPSVVLWSQPTSASVLSVPAVADLDGDGILEAVAGDDEGNVYCFSGRSGFTRWVFKAQDAVQAPFSIAGQNVFFGSNDKHLYCLNGSDGRQRWSFATQGAILGPTLLKDLNGDGVVDAVFGSADAFVYAVSGADGSLLWKFRTGGRVDSALIWANDTLIVGSADRNAYCLKPTTGELLWKAETESPLIFAPRVEGTTVLFPTPKTAGDVRTRTAVSLTEHKVTGVGDTFPRSIDLDGDGVQEKLVVTEAGTTCYAGTNSLWQSEYPAIAAYTADIDGDGTLDLIFNTDADEVLAISGKNGSIIGRVRLDASVGRGYALDDVDRDGVPDLIMGAGRRVYCFAWNGGRRQWIAKSDSYFDAGLVEVNGRVIAKNNAGLIACYEPGHNDPVWKVSTSPQPAPYGAVAAGQGIVVDADAVLRLVRAFAANDGKLVWSMRLPSKPENPVIGTPGIGQGIVVVGDGVAGVYALSLADGKSRWQVGIPKVVAPPAIDGESVLVADSASNPASSLHCLSLADGKERWKFSTSDPIPGAPVVFENNVIAVCDNGSVYALDIKDGKMLWEFRHTPERTRTRNRLVGDILATSKGDIICLDLKTGKAKWTYALKEPVMSEVTRADMNGDGVPDIIVGTMNRRVHCISGKGDAELWSYEVGGQVRYTTPAVVKGSVLVGTGPPENTLYCLSGNSPRLKDRGWSGPWKELTTAR